MATVQQLAETASGYLRRDQATGRVLPTDDAPEWFGQLCRTAHGDMGPDDWRYGFLQDALVALSETKDTEEFQPDVDSLYPYTHDRLRWLSSRLDRTDYCDDYISTYGGSFSSTDSLISGGMWAELSEVFGLVRSYLEDNAEEITEQMQKWFIEADSEADSSLPANLCERLADRVVSHPLSGESALLAVGVLAEETPIGILLDRLTEYPSECALHPSQLADAVEWLRSRHPNGV